MLGRGVRGGLGGRGMPGGPPRGFGSPPRPGGPQRGMPGGPPRVAIARPLRPAAPPQIPQQGNYLKANIVVNWNFENFPVFNNFEVCTNFNYLSQLPVEKKLMKKHELTEKLTYLSVIIQYVFVFKIPAVFTKI